MAEVQTNGLTEEEESKTMKEIFRDIYDMGI
jgi:hypothetical protein